jgi:predicted transcriptional regulator
LIAQELGVAESTVSTWLKEYAKMTIWQKCIILDKEVGNNHFENFACIKDNNI